MKSKSIDFSKLRVLVIENHELMRRLLGEMLRGFGIQGVRYAWDVPAAIDHVYGERFDLVILDFFLGELDGADFAKHIRHDEDCLNREVPILLITGMPDHHKVMKVLDAGINGMLAKPIAPRDLYSHIQGILTDPKPFVITKDYVGPMRKRDKQPVSRRVARPTPARPQTASQNVVKPNPAYEDGILV